MDLRLLVLTGDPGLAELLRTQAENLGCQCSVSETYESACASFAWADAAVVDVAGTGMDDLHRFRVEAPRLRVLAIATDESLADGARSAGADQVLLEPFAITDVVDALRALGPTAQAQVIDLRTGQASPAPVADELPWFATQ